MSHPSNHPRHDLLTAALSGAACFVIVFAAGFLLGTLRVLLLIPSMGETAAVLLEMPIILGIAWFACRRMVRAFGVPAELAPRLVMGGTAFLILMGAEFGLSALLFGRTAAEHLDQYRETHALLGLAGQIAFGLFPVMQLRKHISR